MYWQSQGASQYQTYDEREQNMLMGEDIRETLMTYADSLEWADTFCHHDDLLMLDDVLMCEMDPVDFLAMCRGETALAMYTDLVRRDILPRAASC